MKIVLSNVGRNLNRCYRTAEAFGFSTMLLHNCSGKLKGNLFKSKGRVELIDTDSIDFENAAYFETDGNLTIQDFDFAGIEYLVFGGETKSLPKSYKKNRIKIPTKGEISGLTVEAALSIVLYEINRRNNEI